MAHLENPEATQVPEADKEFMSNMGFDVAAYLGSGLYGVVFNGICNKYGSYLRSIDREEADLTFNRKVWDPVGKRWFKEINLDGKTCAIKMCEAVKWDDQLYYEAKKSMEFEHPNVVETYMVCKTAQYVYIILEYLNGGTLKDYLYNYSDEDLMPATAALALISQMTSGLQYLHNHDIIHGDFHRGNIMLNQVREDDEVKYLQLKIVDFGNSRPWKKRNNREDLRYLGLHIGIILELADFEDNREDTIAKAELLSVADDLNDGLFRDIDQVILNIMKYVPNLQPSSPLRRLWNFIRKM